MTSMSFILRVALIPKSLLFSLIRDRIFPHYKNVKSKFRDAGATIREDVPFPSMYEVNYEGEDGLEQLWNHDLAREWAEFLKFFDDPPVKSITDIVEFNKEHADKELPPQFPGQQLLELSLKDEMTEAKYLEAFELIRLATRTNGVQKQLQTLI